MTSHESIESIELTKVHLSLITWLQLFEVRLYLGKLMLLRL